MGGADVGGVVTIPAHRAPTSGPKWTTGYLRAKVGGICSATSSSYVSPATGPRLGKKDEDTDPIEDVGLSLTLGIVDWRTDGWSEKGQRWQGCLLPGGGW